MPKAQTDLNLFHTTTEHRAKRFQDFARSFLVAAEVEFEPDTIGFNPSCCPDIRIEPWTVGSFGRYHLEGIELWFRDRNYKKVRRALKLKGDAINIDTFKTKLAELIDLHKQDQEARAQNNQALSAKQFKSGQAMSEWQTLGHQDSYERDYEARSTISLDINTAEFTFKADGLTAQQAHELQNFLKQLKQEQGESNV